MNSMKRAGEAFDSLTAAMWYGFTFREHLANNPKALEAAEALAASIAANKAFMDLVKK